MKKITILAILLMGLCLFSACGAEAGTETASGTATEITSAADTDTDSNGVGEVSTAAKATAATPKSGNASVSVPNAAIELPDPEITAVSLTYSSDSPIVLDLEEKKGSFAAHVEASGYVQKDLIRIYTEDETLVEISDIEIKNSGLVNFYLTGKKVGSSKLYIATADETLVSDPVEIVVRSEEEKTYAEQAVYYSVLGDYWHFSEECAKSDEPDTMYNWQGEEISGRKREIPILQTTRENLLGVGDRTPCPKCAAEEAAQQDGE